MMTLSFIFLFFTFALIFGKFLTPINPISILIITNCIQITLFHVFSYLGTYEFLQTNILYLYALSFLSFTIAFSAGSFLFNQIIKQKHYILTQSRSINFYCHMIGIIGLIWIGYAGISNGLSGNYSFILNLRDAAIDRENYNFGYSTHLLMFYQVFLINQYLQRKDNACCVKPLALYALASFSIAFWKMEKITLVISFCSIMIASFFRARIHHKPIKLLRYAVPAIVMIALLYLFFLIRDFESNLGIALLKFASYALNSIEAFRTNVVDHCLYGDYSKVFGKTGSTILSIFLTPIPADIETMEGFNVYTYLHGMYIFAGASGIFFISFFLGFAYAMVFINGMKYHFEWIIFYSFYSAALVISFFDFIFSSNIFIYYLLSIIAISFVSKKQSIILEKA